MNQKGFATLEIILMVMVIGILATMAVPQFEKITAAANTSKVQSDLAAMNAAIAVYQMEKGTTPTAITDLAPYLENGVPQAPTGSIYVITTDNGTTATPTKMTGNTWVYAIDSTSGKATFGGYAADKFTTKS